jgi:lysine-ketoglutarate reductase/saccharopine dehydrogenase-like protein (TIGR00300 family)
MTDQHEPGANHVEVVELSGHIIDSLILPKVLDSITAAGGSFQINKITVGQGQRDPSFAEIQVRAPTNERLKVILEIIADHGAVPVLGHDCQLVTADIDGAFPEGFYSTTNQRTEVRIDNNWIEVAKQEMDCGVCIGPDQKSASCVAMSDVQSGQTFVVGHAGVRVFPPERRHRKQGFEFMNSAVSTEKPKGVIVRQVARQLFENRASGGETLIVGGPALVHTGSVEHLSQLIRDKYVHRLFAGNALATHDIEQAFFGTSLGVQLDCGDSVEAGHEHHLRSINRIRRLGGIREAVEAGELTSGIMYECVKQNVPFLLAGSIRDDGPLPEVITDALEAQRQMREQLQNVTLCLMVATMLHSVAVGNLLPAWVDVVCVDINPSTVIKLGDRGSFQTVGIVTDVEPFMRALVNAVKLLEKTD